MSHLALAVALVAGAAAQEAPVEPAGQSEEVVQVLTRAVEAIRALQSISYDARLTVRAGDRERVVAGHVLIDRFKFSDPIGGRIAVNGKVVLTNDMQVKKFQLAYDGVSVRRHLVGSQRVLVADVGFGGEGLMLGNFGSLVVRNLIAAEPYTSERLLRQTAYLGRQDLDGTAVDVIEIRTDDGKEMRWFLDAETALPARREQEFLSANGLNVQSVLDLSNVEADPSVESTAFELEVPEGAKLEYMGKKPPPPFEVGDTAPEWELTDAEGKVYRLEDYRGRLLVLDFWSSWCPHCNDSMPAMQRMHDEYKDRGVAILALNCRERGPVDPVAYVRERGFDYPVLDGNKIAPAYRVRGIPAFFVIDPEGVLLHRSSGFDEAAEETLEGFMRQYAR